MLHTVNAELFEAFRNILLRTSVDELDERMKEIVALFNQIPGVATVFSCSGHTEEELIAGQGTRWKNNSHIIFVIKEGYGNIINYFSEWLSTIDHGTWVITRPHLELTQLVYPGGDRPLTYSNYRYNAVIIKLNFIPAHQEKSIEYIDKTWKSLISFINDKIAVTG